MFQQYENYARFLPLGDIIKNNTKAKLSSIGDPSIFELYSNISSAVSIMCLTLILIERKFTDNDIPLLSLQFNVEALVSI